MPKPPELGATLADWLVWLEGRDPAKIELGLARVKRVLDRLELPPRNCPLITVAGTNGKGSVVASLDALGGGAGLRVGCYLSPHLLRFNERIRLAGDDVDDAELLKAFAQVAAAEQGDTLTYFEFATLAAFAVLSAAQLDLWVLEVGLGGRLDAVNVLDADLAIITSIGFDHTDWLGDSLAGIAREKAGIFRSGKPVISGVSPSDDATVQMALSEAAEVLDAPLWQLGRDIIVETHKHWTLSVGQQQIANLPQPALPGPMQINNAALAISALLRLRLIEPSLVADGLKLVRLPGRCQVVATAPEVIIDTAHNAEAARALAQALQARGAAPGSVHMVLGMLQGKPVAAVVAALAEWAAHWHFCSLPGPRGLAAAELQGLAGTVGQLHQSVADGLAAARESAGHDGQVLAVGSFLTAEAVLKSLAMSPASAQIT